MYNQITNAYVKTMVLSKDTKILYNLVDSIDRELEATDNRTSELQRRIKALADVNEAGDLQELTEKSISHKSRVKDDYEARIEELENRQLELIMKIQKEEEITEKCNEIITSNIALYLGLKESLENRSNSRDILSENIKKQFTQSYIKNSNTVIDQLDLNIFNLFQNIHKVEKQLKMIISSSEKDNEVINSAEYQEDLNKLVEMLNTFFNEHTLKHKESE